MISMSETKKDIGGFYVEKKWRAETPQLGL